MLPMPVGDLHAISRELAETGRRVHVLWQEPETLLFVARGREYRSEFHINPSSEVMYMISGEMNLHYRDPDGKESIQVLKAGQAVYTAPLIPHSPRFPPDAFLLVQERRRRPGEIDRFQWFCPECDSFLHEEEFVVEWLDRSTGELIEPLDPESHAHEDPVLGELVLTNLGRIGSPAVRYRTGDVARLCAAGCPCGRPTVYLDGGVLARADDMFIVRGVNVYPSAVDALIREAGGVAEYRATVRQRRQMVEVELEVEPEPGSDDGALRDRLQELFEERLSLRIPVRTAAPGSLPRYELKANRFTFERT